MDEKFLTKFKTIFVKVEQIEPKISNLLDFSERTEELQKLNAKRKTEMEEIKAENIKPRTRIEETD